MHPVSKVSVWLWWDPYCCFWFSNFDLDGCFYKFIGIKKKRKEEEISVYRYQQRTNMIILLPCCGSQAHETVFLLVNLIVYANSGSQN
jgi:hypothetical protein